jgi:hypothetical protein
MFTRTPIDQIGFANRPHGRLRLFLLLPLAQPHPRPSAVLIDELDAGDLKRVLYHLKCCPARFVASSLYLANRYYAHTCLLGQIRLTPIE